MREIRPPLRPRRSRTCASSRTPTSTASFYLDERRPAGRRTSSPIPCRRRSSASGAASRRWRRPSIRSTRSREARRSTDTPRDGSSTRCASTERRANAARTAAPRPVHRRAEEAVPALPLPDVQARGRTAADGDRAVAHPRRQRPAPERARERAPRRAVLLLGETGRAPRRRRPRPRRRRRCVRALLRPDCALPGRQHVDRVRACAPARSSATRSGCCATASRPRS